MWSRMGTRTVEICPRCNEYSAYQGDSQLLYSGCICSNERFLEDEKMHRKDSPLTEDDIKKMREEEFDSYIAAMVEEESETTSEPFSVRPKMVIFALYLGVASLSLLAAWLFS